MRNSFFPSKICTSLNKINIQLLHIHWWLSSKKIKMRSCTNPPKEKLHSLYHIRNPMDKTITKSKNMNSPSNNIIVLIFIHIFPSKLMLISKYKIMNNKFCRSCKNISLSTKFFCPIFSNNLYFNSINIILF